MDRRLCRMRDAAPSCRQLFADVPRFRVGSDQIAATIRAPTRDAADLPGSELRPPCGAVFVAALARNPRPQGGEGSGGPQAGRGPKRPARQQGRAHYSGGALAADAVAQAGDASHLRAMLAAEEGAVLLQPVADDADAAVLAGRRQRVDRAFETVEGVRGSAHAHLERLVVIVPAGFTSGHGSNSRWWGAACGDNSQVPTPVPVAQAGAAPQGRR